jgi:hypothetical protein
MRITKVTPLSEQKHDPNVELYVGDYDDWKDEWHRSEIAALQAELTEAGIDYRPYHLMQKAIGFDDAIVVGLATWLAKRVFDVLVAWLPAREGRKVRIKFKDGTEIEANSVKELDQIRSRFLPEPSRQDPSKT